MSKLETHALRAKDILTRCGVDAFAITSSQARSVETEWRIGTLERVQDKTHHSVSVEIYIDGRYAGFSTNDLRADALQSFLKRAVEMTRLLEPDPCRSLPDCPIHVPPMELDLYDSNIEIHSANHRLDEMKKLNAALESMIGDTAYASYTTSLNDGWGHYLRMFSNGFSEEIKTSSFGRSATLSLKDSDGRLPLGWDGSYARHKGDLVSEDLIANNVVQRARAQLQASTIPTRNYDVILVNRVMGKVLGPVLRPLGGAAIQQGRSLWKDRLHERVLPTKLSIFDNPHIQRGLGSAQFDGDGFEVHQRPLIENGVLKTFLINHYYAQKLGCERTGGNTHNLQWNLGEHDLQALASQVQNGLLIERFLGGNCNETTGNFSYGCAGRRIENGQLTSAFSEANLSGNIEAFWGSLALIGNDVLPQSTSGAPSCAFLGAQVSGA